MMETWIFSFPLRELPFTQLALGHIPRQPLSGALTAGTITRVLPGVIIITMASLTLTLLEEHLEVELWAIGFFKTTGVAVSQKSRVPTLIRVKIAGLRFGAITITMVISI